MSRKILIEFTIDWEGYEDVADELVVEDMGIPFLMKGGVSYEIKPQTTPNDKE